MKLYNDYISDCFVKNLRYESKICFVKTLDKDFFYKKNGAYITFKNDKLSGYYELSSDLINDNIGNAYYLSTIFNKGEFLEINSDILKDIRIIMIKFSYIKIIEDKINPHLNGKYFIFRVDNKLNNELMIKKPYLNKYNFKLVVERIDHTHFTGSSSINYDKTFVLYDEENTLNSPILLEDEIKFKNINFNSLRRLLKLKKLNIK